MLSVTDDGLRSVVSRQSPRFGGMKSAAGVIRDSGRAPAFCFAIICWTTFAVFWSIVVPSGTFDSNIKAYAARNILPIINATVAIAGTNG